MDDTSLLIINVKDDIVFKPDNTTEPVKVISFRLGKTGPYVEKMTPQQFIDGELNVRVAKLQAVLSNLPG